MRENEGTSGFTLIEVLVALVIFVAGYVVVHQSVSLAWHGARIAWTETATLRLAQSRLAAAGVATELLEGEQSGETPDGFVWTVRVERYAPPGADDAAQRMAAYWVTVTVQWSRGAMLPGRSLQLKTLKLAAGA
jgi:prepilin-type N-terminal cleavage/methylation domain-containing protein